MAYSPYNTNRHLYDLTSGRIFKTDLPKGIDNYDIVMTIRRKLP